MSDEHGYSSADGVAALLKELASRGCGVGVEQSGDRRIAAQPVQAAAAAWPDAPDRDAQPRADLGVRHGWILHEHGDQPLATWGQAGKRLVQRCMPLARQQLLLGHFGLLAGDVPGV